MQPQEIKNIVAQAASEKRFLRILGYRTNDGEVIDYTIEILGPDGYKGLVKASLETVLGGKIAKPADIDPEAWHLALTEQTESWRRTLAGAQAARTFSKTLVPQPGGYSVDPEAPEVVVLQNMRYLERTIVSAVEKPLVKSSAKTLAKAEIKKQTPLETFVGQLNLAPGKFDSIHLT